MDAEIQPVTPGERDWIASQRKWTHGWRRSIPSLAFLVYLLYVVQAVGQYSHGASAIWGYAILAAFCVCILLIAMDIRHGFRRGFWILYGILVALFVAELPFAHAAAFVMCLYIAAIAVAALRVRAIAVVVGLALAALLVPVAISSWHDSFGTALNRVTPIAIPVVGIVTYVVVQIVEANRAIAEARAEVARLAAENERIRIARDLHDLLGHSLTTITVKAGLAGRLGRADPARALQEIAEVEALARRSLADVRAAVANYRDVTLAGELATGRELLLAAGIDADLPRSIDAVGDTHQELFGWVVREGLTNVVRHARASSCAVRLSSCGVEIVDDGVGGSGQPGSGLSGLRERAAAVGGVLEAGPHQPRGWRLRVSLAPVA
jgi:two-component system sensor histidine kinase DesK